MSLEGRAILATGATGFLGGRVARALAARGAKLHLVARRPEVLRSAFPDARVSALDLESPELGQKLPALLQGMDAVIHMAAVVKTWLRDRSTFDRVNVAATETLLSTCRDVGLERVYYVSSFIALGPTDGATFTEGDERRDGKTRNDYERTKTEADRRARAALEAGLPLTIFYPGVIYGPGEMTDGNLVVKTARDFYRGKVPGLLGGGTSRWSYAFVEDVAEGICRAIEAGRAGERYLLGGENATGKELFDLLAGILGRPRLTRAIPYGLAKAVGATELLLAHLSGRTPSLTPAVVEIFKHDWALDSRKAEAALGYRVTPLRDGLSQTLSWMRREKLL